MLPPTGLGLPILVREGVQVEGRRQAPLAAAEVKKTQVLQMIVHMGDQQIECKPPPQLPQIPGLHSVRG